MTPRTPNGFKFEQFVFDVFPFVDEKRFVALEVERAEEFSPLKNRTGSDSPETCARHLFAYHRRLLEAAGARFEVSSEGDQEGEEIVCEISPIVSFDGEDLSPLVSGRVLLSPFYLDSPDGNHSSEERPF